MTTWVCPKCKKAGINNSDISYDDEIHLYICAPDLHMFANPLMAEEPYYDVEPKASPESRRVDSYLSTISRLEPEVAAIDASAFYASAAISLKRIADLLWELQNKPK